MTRRVWTVVLAATAVGMVLAVAVAVIALRPAARTQRHWRQAEAFLKGGQFTEAAIVLQNIVRDDPRSARAYLKLGHAYLSLHNYRQAFQAYSRAAMLDPELLEAQLRTGQLLLMSRKFDEARAKAQLIISKAPAAPEGSPLFAPSYLAAHDVNFGPPFQTEAHLLLGDVLLAQGKVRGALDQYKFAATLKPNEPKIHYAIGRVYTISKQYDWALGEFEQALALDPNLVEALAGVASVHWTKGNRSRAIARVRGQIEQSPKNAQFHNLLGTLYLSAGELSNAEQSFAAAIRIDPKRPTSYLLLGDTYVKTKRYDLAAKTFEEAIQVDPTNAPAYLRLGIAQESQNHLDAAARSFTKAVELNPSLVPALNNLAWYYAETKQDPAAAERYAARALALAPHDPFVLDTQGWISYRLGRYDDAVRYISESAQLQKRRPVVLYHLGMAHLRAGRKDLARKELREALSLDQDFPGASEARATLLRLR